MKNLMISIDGFLMALADSVPGVSGGTVAFLMGIYDEFITSLTDIFGLDNEKRKKAFFFLLKLGIGWVIGFTGAVSILATLFTEKIYAVSSAFLGFIILSIPIVIKEEKDTLKKDIKTIPFLIPGIAIVVLLSVFNPVGGEGGLDLSNPNILTYIYIIVSGMAAISAMVLPGISGSTILMVCGLYIPVISSIKNILHFDFSGFNIVFATGIGILLGIIFVMRFIKAALEKHRGAMLYFIIGMMIGSLYAIIVGPETLDEPQPPMTFSTFNILGFIIGCVIILLLQYIKVRAEKKISESGEKAE